MERNMNQADEIDQTALETALWANDLNDSVYIDHEDDPRPHRAAAGDPRSDHHADMKDRAHAELEPALWANTLNDILYLDDRDELLVSPSPLRGAAATGVRLGRAAAGAARRRDGRRTSGVAAAGVSGRPGRASGRVLPATDAASEGIDLRRHRLRAGSAALVTATLRNAAIATLR